MSDLPVLFSDLALILVTAGLTTVIFKWLKQPLVLGYIIAGFLIGPYFGWFPNINDHTSVETWSEIGMVFLLFAIGLEFSFKKLKKVGGTVGITALTELVSMCLIGFFLGKLLGWSKMDCMFLGAMLSMSSTTIIAKAFDDLKLKHEKFTESVIGVLVVEDLAAILMMVILSTLSVSQTFNGKELVFSMLKLVFFLLIWFIGGIYLIPSLLKWIRKFMSEETLTVFAVGLCFLMVVLANIAGFSSALGAFIMGSILAETLEAELIHKLTTPIKNLFGAVFFVSVGMMVDPSVLVQYWWQILVITLVVLSLKSLSSMGGMMLAGNNLKTSMQAGFCFGQIGEFSFIIATVGMSFGVIDNFLYPIIVSVSIITTFLTPYTINAALPCYNWLEKRIPEKWRQRFSNKDTGLKVKSGKQVDMRSFLMRQLKNMVIYVAIIIALMLVCFFIDGYIMRLIPGVWSSIINCAITLIVLSPFLWAVAFKHKSRHANEKLMKVDRFNKTIISLVFAIRYVAVILFVYNILTHYINFNHLALFGIALAFFGLLRISNRFMRFYERIENRFLENMNKRDDLQVFAVPEVLQENFRLEKMSLSQDSEYVGKIIAETDFRSNYNISVVSVERGRKVFDLPDKDFLLFPMDVITFVGSDEQIVKLKGKVEIEDEVLVRETVENDVDLHKMVVTKQTPFCHVSLRESGFSKRYKAMVIAVERDNDFMLNPSANIVFEENDVVWFVGSRAIV